MKCPWSAIVSVFCCVLVVASVRAAEPVVTEGRVSAVTVYQGQALVTRDLDVPQAEGLLEIVVTNLPDNVLPGSLFAEPVDGAQVRSVRYRARPVEEDVRQEVRELDEQIQVVSDKLQAVAQERALLNQRKGYLSRLENLSAMMSQQDLNRGLLNAGTLKELSLFLFTESAKIVERELALAKEERTHNQEKDLLTRKRDTVAAGSARTVREAVVFLNVPQAGDAKLRLSYLVSGANWSPSYNVRATDARDQITLEYNASIEQMSGEDWNDVEMTLSTATPSLVAKAPALEPLAIKLGALVQEAQKSLSTAENYRQVQDNLSQLGKLRGTVSAGGPARPNATDASMRGSGFGGVGSWDFSSSGTVESDERINSFACALQLLDFNNSLSELRSDSQREPQLAEGVSVSYILANRTSIPSRSDRQLIQIAAVPLTGDFYRLATPVLTNFVYEEARLTNSSDYVFLAGPVATFLGGQFVGRGDLPTVTMGESFTVGLGIDSSLRAERELVDKVERIQGGNRVVDFTYKMSIENFGSEPATVRLLDRLPIVEKDDIKVTLLKSDEPVSDDETYQMTAEADGVLRWDIVVPAQAVGPKQKVLHYTMQLEYDKQLAIVGLASTN